MPRGPWNEAGASLDFSVAPAYYQTFWFRLFCVAAFMALLGGLYRLRFANAQPAKEMQFHHLTLPRVDSRQCVKPVVQGYEVGWRLAGDKQSLVQSHTGRIPAPFHVTSGAGEIRQHAGLPIAVDNTALVSN